MTMMMMMMMMMMIMMMMMMMMMMTIPCTLGRERVKTNLLIHGYSQNPFLYFFTFILLKTSSRENRGIFNTLHYSSAFTLVVYNLLIISTIWKVLLKTVTLLALVLSSKGGKRYKRHKSLTTEKRNQFP